ncbi:MAG: oligoribonuclease [Halothiobacillaceae bacterium]
MQNRLIWIDLEMTGLEPERDVIIEIATLVTDEQLNILAEGPTLAIHQSESVLAGMDEWNQTHHSASGLLERVRSSPHQMTDAEQLTLDFLKTWSDKRSSPMCGNSICQDRRFLARHMPNLEDFFHYRNLDVSTIKELARRWYPNVPKFEKAGAHRALDDIRASLDELRYYRETILR